MGKFKFKKGDEVRQPSTGRRGTIARVTSKNKVEQIFVVDSAGTGGWYPATDWDFLKNFKEWSQFRKLAGIQSLTEHANWVLSEAPATFAVGDTVRSASDAGIDSNKTGEVLVIDGGWSQIAADGEELWLPNSKLSRVE